VADDAAIWVDEAQPQQSLIIGTDKGAGLVLYDLSGRKLQYLPLGKANNVDVRSHVHLVNGPAAIVAVSNMSNGSVQLLRLDDKNRRLLSDPLLEIESGVREDAGVCLYHAPDGALHIGATGTGGRFRQWRVRIGGDGALTTEPLRSIDFESQVESCVFDDILKRLYVGEEKVGIWRFSADPMEGDAAELVDAVQPRGTLVADVEGLALYTLDDGTGYLLASSQGDSTFRLYRRDGENSYIGSFRVRGCGDGSISGISGTDGIAATSTPLGESWPKGLVVIHDGGSGPGFENFKLVDWQAIDLARK
jgi:3-phytase